MSESIELATILLTDLVGSTRLATSVGPGRADELRDEHFGLLRVAIETSGGREFKNTGDGLFVAFPSASAAVGCAALMQQLLERRYRNAAERLHMRIGLGAGESTVQNGDYFGMPSIEAARLCDSAPTDGVLVSPTVRLLAGRAVSDIARAVSDSGRMDWPRSHRHLSSTEDNFCQRIGSLHDARDDDRVPSSRRRVSRRGFLGSRGDIGRS